MVDHWIWSVSAGNWEIVRERNVNATYSKYASGKVHRGDILVFYVKGSGAFLGSFKIVGDWYETKELLWPDEIAAKEKLYPHECKLERIRIGEATVSDLIPRLSFIGNKAFYGNYLRGSHGGPANFSRSISAQDYEIILENMTEPSTKSPIVEELAEETEGHEDIVAAILEIGTMMGLESSDDREDTQVAKGAVLDAVWKLRVAGFAELRYAFELQRKGSIDSLVRNLERAARNPSVRGLVIVASNEHELERIKDEAYDMMEDLGDRVSLITVNELKKAYEHFKATEDFREKLRLKIY
jgi:predicted RNA-binding protein